MKCMSIEVKNIAGCQKLVSDLSHKQVRNASWVRVPPPQLIIFQQVKFFHTLVLDLLFFQSRQSGRVEGQSVAADCNNEVYLLVR